MEPSPARVCRRRGIRAAMVALGLAVSGCAAASHRLPPALPYPAPDLAFTMPDGTVLPAREWLPAGAPRGVVLALHGFGDSRDAWALPAPAFAADGLLVVAPDQRGFGATATRGHWAGTEAMVADAAALVRQLRGRWPGLPVTVMGESMGGAVAMLLAAAPDMPGASAPDTTVLVSPAVWTRAQLGVVLSSSLFLANAFLPDHEVTGSEVPLHLVACDNRDALLRLYYDPLTLHATRFAALSGLVTLMDEASAATWGALPATARRAFYTGGYHMLLRDLDRALPVADILAWLRSPDAWLPSGADAAAAAWQAGQSWRGEPSAWLPAGLDDLAPGESPTF
ncbi:MAG: alpha/beta hydrolase [Janthinobacterium lividum]